MQLPSKYLLYIFHHYRYEVAGSTPALLHALEQGNEPTVAPWSPLLLNNSDGSNAEKNLPNEGSIKCPFLYF